VGQRTGIADQSSIAQITVFKGCAITVTHAFAGNLGPGANAVAAFISHRAGIAIVAVNAIGFVVTTAGFAARIVGAGIVVVTIHRLSNTNTALAVVGHSARIPIYALSLVQCAIDTSISSQATILSTAVAILTKMYEVTAHQIRLVNITIAIIIGPVADLFGRQHRIAR